MTHKGLARDKTSVYLNAANSGRVAISTKNSLPTAAFRLLKHLIAANNSSGIYSRELSPRLSF